MEILYDPLLDPYNFVEEDPPLEPQEIQSLKKKRNHEPANNIRNNVPF